MAKCGVRSSLWPCVVRSFLGYDEEEVQVYSVDFIGTKDYANLETYNLIPITREKLERMKRRPNRMFRHENYMLALKEAEIKIEELKKDAHIDNSKMTRFLKLYCSDPDPRANFIQVEKIKPA